MLGNMVPACARCDDSKGASPYREWALGDAKYSPKKWDVSDIEERLHRIDSYVKKYRYRPKLPNTRLSPKEFQALKDLEDELQQLHNNFNAFIEQYRRRIGGG